MPTMKFIRVKMTGSEAVMDSGFWWLKLAGCHLPVVLSLKVSRKCFRGCRVPTLTILLILRDELWF